MQGHANGLTTKSIRLQRVPRNGTDFARRCKMGTIQGSLSNIRQSVSRSASKRIYLETQTKTTPLLCLFAVHQIPNIMNKTHLHDSGWLKLRIIGFHWSEVKELRHKELCSSQCECELWCWSQYDIIWLRSSSQHDIWMNNTIMSLIYEMMVIIQDYLKTSNLSSSRLSSGHTGPKGGRNNKAL